eukprot:4322302-Amphidinium_carterae.1
MLPEGGLRRLSPLVVLETAHNSLQGFAAACILARETTQEHALKRSKCNLLHAGCPLAPHIANPLVGCSQGWDEGFSIRTRQQRCFAGSGAEWTLCLVLSQRGKQQLWRGTPHRRM